MVRSRRYLWPIEWILTLTVLPLRDDFTLNRIKCVQRFYNQELIGIRIILNEIYFDKDKR